MLTIKAIVKITFTITYITITAIKNKTNSTTNKITTKTLVWIKVNSNKVYH